MLSKKIEEIGFDNVKEIPVSEIFFEPSLIKFCEMNQCGNYGKNYTCPPHIGETDELIKKAKSYENILVFQKIYALEDSFDIEGMNEGNQNFRELVEQTNTTCKKNIEDYLLLGAGGCKACETCGVVDGVPCRFPERAFASLESYSIYVSALATACDMKYINGQNTVTYFGGVLY